MVLRKEGKPKDKSKYSILFLLIPVIGVVFMNRKYIDNKPLMILYYVYSHIIGFILGYSTIIKL